MVKVVVIGLDSACWEILDPWIKDDKLPTLKKLKEKGTYGDLKSSFPFMTAPAWKCYSTGKNPGKLGVFHWFKFDKGTKELKVNNSDSFDGKEIWDYLSNKKLKCGVINMPLTFPPKNIFGFMISGCHAFDWNEYTYPAELKSYIKKKFCYELSPKHHYINLEKVIPESKELIEKRFDVAFDLAIQENIDFLQITIFVIDALHHYHWDLLKNKNSPLLEVWKTIDKKIEEAISTLDPDILFLVSDHGITGIRAHFRANEWLEREGYLHWRKKRRINKFSFVEILNKIGISKEFIASIFTLAPSKIKKWIPNEVIIKKAYGAQFVDEKGDLGISATIDNVNWNKTSAIVIGEGLLYIFDKNISKSEKKKLVNKLKNIKNPRNDEIMLDIKPKNSIYHGKYLEIAPDFYLAPKKGYYVSDKLSSEKKVFDFENKKWQAYHKLEGLLIAYGKDVKKRHEIKNAEIYDLAPTILHILELPIPEDMDGKVLTEIFEEGSDHMKKEVEYIDPNYYEEENEKEKIKEQIEKLKKLRKL